MNPLLIARNLRDEYLRLLKTHFNPRQPQLKAAFNREIETGGFLTREPFVALSQPYEIAPPLTELHALARERFAPISETPYQHQADACKRILAGQPTVLATGTGSGKTEAFLMPIIDHCLRAHKDGENSVKAVLIYPMNALANDQCSRIRKMLDGTDVSYGRYTRDTKMFGSRPADAPKNERITRLEFRKNPPDLLLTNYMMLEYMLMRGDGRDILRDHRVQFIVLDEVHTYHGLLGTDVACLMRRLREFAPGQIIYARGGRWRVTGIALHRPGSHGSSDQSMFDFTLCGSCGLANDPNHDFCARCKAQIGDDSGAGLKTFVAWDAGAFQAWEAEVAAESEEERLRSAFDIHPHPHPHPHPQADADGTRRQVGDWALDLRQQESLWFINHGLKTQDKAGDEKAESPGFQLCPTCGDYFGEKEQEKAKAAKPKAGNKDSRSRMDAHARRCAGTPRDFSIGHKLHADTLRLYIPEMGKLGEDGVAWAWSLVYAMIQGAVRLFEIDEGDIEGHVLTKTVTEEGRQPYEEVLDILWIDRIIGGSGTLQRLATHFPKVATAALKHLDDHDCPNSCYRCLRSYRNQRWHSLLDWRLVVPFLRALSGETVSAPTPIKGVAPVSFAEGPEWVEARAEGCESPRRSFGCSGRYRRMEHCRSRTSSTKSTKATAC